MKSPLSETEKEAFERAIRREKFDREAFKRAQTKLIFGSALRPDWAVLDREIPRTLADWRADTQWSLDFADKHQQACEAAWSKYWQVMTSQEEQLATFEDQPQAKPMRITAGGIPRFKPLLPG